MTLVNTIFYDASIGRRQNHCAGEIVLFQKNLYKKFSKISMLEKIFSEKCPVGKIIYLCVRPVVCKDFEKFKSSRVWGCELYAVEFKDFENFKVPRVWVWPLHFGT